MSTKVNHRTCLFADAQSASLICGHYWRLTGKQEGTELLPGCRQSAQKPRFSIPITPFPVRKY